MVRLLEYIQYLVSRTKFLRFWAISPHICCLGTASFISNDSQEVRRHFKSIESRCYIYKSLNVSSACRCFTVQNVLFRCTYYHDKLCYIYFAFSRDHSRKYGWAIDKERTKIVRSGVSLIRTVPSLYFSIDSRSKIPFNLIALTCIHRWYNY